MPPNRLVGELWRALSIASIVGASQYCTSSGLGQGSRIHSKHQPSTMKSLLAFLWKWPCTSAWCQCSCPHPLNFTAAAGNAIYVGYTYNNGNCAGIWKCTLSVCRSPHFSLVLQICTQWLANKIKKLWQDLNSGDWHFLERKGDSVLGAHSAYSGL